MKRLCLLALLCLATLPAAALPPLTVTVHDLNSTGDPAASLNPRSGVLFNSQFFFVGGVPADRELWVSSLAGTSLFLDLVPGTLGSTPAELTVAGTRMFFVAKTADHGRELWQTDGTALGTSRVTDFHPGPLDSSPSELLALGSWLYYLATDDGSNSTLRRTEVNTLATEEVVANLAIVGHLVGVASEVFFVAANTDGREEIWRSDGTEAGTEVVTDTNCIRISELVTAGNVAFFTCDRDLWVTDGSFAGSSLLRHFDAADPQALTVTRTIASHGATQFYFSASDDPVSGQNLELWVSDGSVAGTVPMPEIAPGTASSRPGPMIADQGELIFSAETSTEGRELYWTNAGALSGAVLNTCGSGLPVNFLRHGAFVYFSGCDCAAGCELWRTNRTVGGTTLVEDIAAGTAGSSVIPLVSSAVGLLFLAGEPGVGSELWRSNGTAVGTLRLTNHEGPDSNPTGLVATDQGVRFGASHQNGLEPWQISAHLGGPAEIADVVPGFPGSSAFTRNGATMNEGITIFTASNAGNSVVDSLWRTDGTLPGTFELMALDPSVAAADFVAVGRLVFFVTGDTTFGRELWRSDGTVAGTFLALDISPGASSSNPSDLVALAGHVYFSASDPSFGNELWRSAGSAAGTTRLTDLEVGTGDAFPFSLTAAGSKLFFVATTAATGFELWAWDSGVTTGFDLEPGTQGSFPRDLVPWGANVAFTVSDGSANSRLWRSDGTVPGTIELVAAVRGGSADLAPLGATSGGLVYWQQDYPNYELRVASGTPGTSTLLGNFDALPFNVTPRPMDIAILDGVLYFGGTVTATSGEELWRTDGTVAGTELIDLVPGPLSSTPQHLVTAAGRLYFAANHLTLGRELYQMMTTPIFSDAFETGTTGAWDLALP